MSLDIDKGDVVTVSEAIYPLLGIGVSDFAQIQFQQLIINVNDNVGLSKLIAVSEVVTITESVALAVGAVSVCTVNVSESLQISDDGQGVALQGGPGAIIQVSAVDHVALSKLIIQPDSITVTESVTLGFASGGTRLINLFENVTVSEALWGIPVDYIVVSESRDVYFRQWNAAASDAVTIAELATLLIQGGTGAAVQLNVSDGLTVAESQAVGIPPMPNVHETLIAGDGRTVNVPLMPKPFDSVTAAEAVTQMIPGLLIAVNESVMIDEAATLRYSRLLLSIAEDISVVESNGISRPSQPWEPGADSSSTWNGSGSTSDDWEPGAVEETVWA